MLNSKLTINLVVSDAISAMEFYEKVFNAVRGDVFHFPERNAENEANIMIGDVCLRLIDENSDYDCHPPNKDETDSMWLQIVVEDTDATLKMAVENGAVIGQEVSEFMGTRHAEITDPYGYIWTVNQILEEITFEKRYEFYKELQRERDENKE